MCVFTDWVSLTLASWAILSTLFVPVTRPYIYPKDHARAWAEVWAVTCHPKWEFTALEGQQRRPSRAKSKDNGCRLPPLASHRLRTLLSSPRYDARWLVDEKFRGFSSTLGPSGGA